MRKPAFALVAALAVGAPTAASAQGFGFYIGGDEGYRGGEYREYRSGPVEYREHDRGWHRGWDRDWDRRHYRRGERVIIRRHYHGDWNDYD
jgi:hypothetical protein